MKFAISKILSVVSFALIAVTTAQARSVGTQTFQNNVDTSKKRKNNALRDAGQSSRDIGVKRDSNGSSNQEEIRGCGFGGGLRLGGASANNTAIPESSLEEVFRTVANRTDVSQIPNPVSESVADAAAQQVNPKDAVYAMLVNNFQQIVNDATASKDTIQLASALVNETGAAFQGKTFATAEEAKKAFVEHLMKVAIDHDNDPSTPPIRFNRELAEKVEGACAI